MNAFLNGVTLILAIPAAAAAVLAVLSDYRLSARLNMLASLLTLLAAVWLLLDKPPAGDYLNIDDLNVVFIVLTAFVSFTTSVFSASYIGHELEIGRLAP